MPDYRKLRVFELAQELSVAVHAIAPGLPARRAPGLTAQLCRAVASIPANIAEGAAQETQAGYARFLRIALGSANEAAVHLQLAASVADGTVQEFRRCRNRSHVVAAMLNRLISRVQEDTARAADAKRSEAPARKQRYQGERSSAIRETVQNVSPIADDLSP